MSRSRRARRLLHCAVALGAMLGAFAVYRVAVVPWVDPGYVLARSEGISPGDRLAVAESLKRRTRELAPLFPPGAWELDNPKILESDRFILLLNDYENLTNQTVRIRPCTLVFLPDGEGMSRAEAIRGAVVLEAPEGAILKFDEGFNLRRMSVGKLLAGEMPGAIIIRSAGKSPGAEDDLWVKTYRVQLDSNELRTDSALEFRWGPNHGRGRRLVVKFAGRSMSGAKGGQPGAPDLNRVESLEITQVDRLHVELQGPHDGRARWAAHPAGMAALGPGSNRPREERTPVASRNVSGNPVLDGPPVGSTAVSGPPVGSATDLSFDLLCRGPFRYDVASRTASFEDQVQVWRLHAQGPADQLNCDRLSITLMERPAAPGTTGSAGSPNTGGAPVGAERGHAAPPTVAGAGMAETARAEHRGAGLRLVPQRVEARGLPVKVTAPSEQLVAQGEVLAYDCETRWLTLDGRDGVWLQQSGNEIRAGSLQYQPAERGGLGRIAALGPGSLRTERPGRAETRMEARWGDRLLVRPQDHNQVLSILGATELRLGDLGAFRAAQIHFWFDEVLADATASPTGATSGTTVGTAGGTILGAPSGAPSGAPRGLPGAGEWSGGRELSAGREGGISGGAFDPSRPSWEIKPDRLMATGKVEIDSPTLAASFDELRVWFEPDAAAPPGQSDPAARAADADGALRGDARARLVSLPADGAPRQAHMPVYAGAPTPTGSPARAGMPAHAGAPVVGAPPGGATRYELSGRNCMARAIARGRSDFELTRVVVDGDARLVGRPIQTDGGPSLQLQGDRIEGVDVQRPSGAFSITGNPAWFEGRGLALRGANIHLHRGKNLLWIDAPGEMTLRLDRDFEGRPLAEPGRLQVVWQSRMVFDGRSACFEESVVATHYRRAAGPAGPGRLVARAATGEALDPFAQLRTDTLEVQLEQAVRFDRPAGPAEPRPELILCRGGVSVESRTLADAASEAEVANRGAVPGVAVAPGGGVATLASVDRMEVADLSINLLSGALTAGGPGWINTVRPGPDMPAPRTAPAATSAPGGATAAGAAGAAAEAGLKCLHVRFQGSISGDLRSRQLTFHDQVRAVYAPATSWTTVLSPDAVDGYGKSAVVLRCDRLGVAWMPQPSAVRRSVELEATGNTVVETEGLTARALRITYDEAKDFLVLEGDGRNDAELFLQQQLGGPVSTATAKRIHCWPKSNRLQVDGARSLDLNGLPDSPWGNPFSPRKP